MTRDVVVRDQFGNPILRSRAAAPPSVEATPEPDFEKLLANLTTCQQDTCPCAGSTARQELRAAISGLIEQRDTARREKGQNASAMWWAQSNARLEAELAESRSRLEEVTRERDGWEKRYKDAVDIAFGLSDEENTRRNQLAAAESSLSRAMKVVQRFVASETHPDPQDESAWKELVSLAASAPRTLEDAKREYDEEDRKKLGAWAQANLSHHAGLSWSEAIAREFSSLRTQLAEVRSRLEEAGADAINRELQLVDLESSLSRAMKERDVARQFVEWAMRDGSWMGGDIDGGDAQDKAEELGLIVEVPASEEFRAEYDSDTMYVVAWDKRS